MNNIKLEFNQEPKQMIKIGANSVPSFVKDSNLENIDPEILKSFSEEWLHYKSFNDDEIKNAGDQYFDIITDKELNSNSLVLDVGCGTGRWAKYIANRAGFVEAIDPSNAVFSAVNLLREIKNIRVSQASANNIPFENNTFDFIYCLGVLHHIPDTEGALENIVSKLTPGGTILIYLYYKLDDKPAHYRIIFSVANFIRKKTSKMPFRFKLFFSNLVAYTVYFPLARLAHLVYRTNRNSKLLKRIPLYYYHDKSLHIMKNDSLDRFGTTIEKRYSRDEIIKLFKDVGLKDIVFSENEPYWHVKAKK